MSAIFWIGPDSPPDEFPDPEHALSDPDGLLAVGGDLSAERLLCAYRKGIFPWFNEGQPILWWSPNPRAVLYPDEFKIHRSLAKAIRHTGFEIRMDHAFANVIDKCAAPRPGDERHATWITADMRHAYIRLYELGYAHSVEVWLDGKLAGGLYGIAIGKVFFGESMFSDMDNASKVALLALCRQLQQWRFRLIDCQVSSEHLRRLGSRDITREEFSAVLRENSICAPDAGRWHFEVGLKPELLSTEQ
ncbi:MAG: leucyl/phenylalanyl-tRNA--protein transferase [Gammaproteobacteria bacterium]|nr:leucyl/phenylalanyl-tRNA--protein transferase [Gammaproteobacteria bacterium]